MDNSIPTPKTDIPIPAGSIPLPGKKTFFNNPKRIKRFAIFLIISGLGAMWLTFAWNNLWNSSSSMFGHATNGDNELIYYIFNSSLLILSGILLLARSYRLYSLAAIVLGISVTASLFVIEDMSNPVIHNLFVSTIILGMTAWFYGGTILVPMFLIGVYMSFVRGIKHLLGKVNYNSQ